MPFATPATSATPSIVIVEDPTLTTFARIGSWEVERSLYWTTLPILAKDPGNNGLALVTVLTPPDSAVIDAIPTLNDVDWITSALKVLTPTTPLFVPKTDLTSEILWEVIAIAILPFSIPSKISDSFKTKFPSVS